MADERYRWARQPQIAKHLRECRMLDEWNAMTAAARRARPAPVPRQEERPPREIPRETWARERGKLEYLWGVWREEAARALADGRPIPTLEQAAQLADAEGWGE